MEEDMFKLFKHFSEVCTRNADVLLVRLHCCVR